FDVIHCQQLSGPAMAGLIAKIFVRKPIIVRLSSTGILGEVRFVQTTRFGSLRRRQLRSVDQWVALTKAMRDEILELGVAPGNITVIPKDRKSTRLNSSHRTISYAVFCLKKKKDRHRSS